MKLETLWKYSVQIITRDSSLNPSSLKIFQIMVLLKFEKLMVWNICMADVCAFLISLKSSKWACFIKRWEKLNFPMFAHHHQPFDMEILKAGFEFSTSPEFLQFIVDHYKPMATGHFFRFYAMLPICINLFTRFFKVPLDVMFPKFGQMILYYSLK